MAENERLRAAVERLYTSFGRYPLKPVTDVCWHCHSPEEERVVHSAPLRQLTPDDLKWFAGDLLMTWGDLADFKHFLPRVFEIVAIDFFTNDHPDIETVLGALDRGGWTTWPAVEREAVHEFLRSFWTATLACWPSHYEVESVLTAIAEAEADLSWYLAAWASTVEPAAVLHFCDLLAAHATRLAEGGPLDIPWLDGRPDREVQVRTWLQEQRPAFAPKVAALLLATTDERARARLSEALDVIYR